MEDNRKSRRIANDTKFLNDKKVSYGRSRSDIDFYNFGLEITKSLEPELFNSIEESNILIIGAGAIGLLCGLILSKVKNCKNIFIVDTNEKRIKESLKYLEADGLNPNDKAIKNNYFDIVFDTVGLETTRQQAIKCIKPGGIIIHIGLTQPSGNFDFRKATLQEITFIGTYCYTNKDFEKTLKILNNKEIGSLNWIEYRELKQGSSAFKDIHNGSCAAPKIILTVNN